jgi:hypothetical protein
LFLLVKSTPSVFFGNEAKKMSTQSRVDDDNVPLLDEKERSVPLQGTKNVNPINVDLQTFIDIEEETALHKRSTLPGFFFFFLL